MANTKEKEIKEEAAVKKPQIAAKKTEEPAKPAKVVVAAAVAADAADAVETSGKKKADKYYEAVGRRKTAIARVRLYTRGDKVFLVNDKPFENYFKGAEFKNVIESPLVKMNCTDRFRITARVLGGGMVAQSEALRHGITRALVLFNADFKKRLKKSGYLTRDPRMKERKKPGLKKARRAPQWAKR
jgi:small subunit ribosomal protein S9